MKVIKYIILLLFFTSLTHCHFFRAEKYVYTKPIIGNVQNIWLLADFHHSTNENKKQIKKQHNEILNLAKQLDAFVIVEDGMIENYEDIINDSSATVKPTYFTKEQLARQKMATPLHGLSSSCYLQGIDCTNAECRFTPYRKLNVYCTFLENKKKQIRTEYKDGAQLEHYYEQRLQFLENTIEKPCKELFDLFKKSLLTIDEFLERQRPLPRIENIDAIIDQITDEKWDLEQMAYQEKVSTILTKYCCAFLDIEMLHALALNKDKKNIIICAGDFHIECLKEALEQIGYTFSNKYGHTIELTEGIDYIEPEAIAINAAYDYLSNSPQAENNRPGFLSFVISLITMIQNTFPFVLNVN